MDYNGSRMADLGAQAEEQAKHQLEQVKNAAANNLVGLTEVQDKNGKKYWLGVEMPPELAETLKTVTSILPTYVNDFVRGGVYKHSSEIFDKLNDKFKFSENKNAGHIAGLRAAAATSALLVGLQPISGVVRSVYDRSKERKSIKEALAGVIEPGSNSYSDNEVIKTALERANTNMVTGFKRAAAEIPSVVLNGYYAVGSHKELVKEKEGAQKIKEVEAAHSGGYEERLKAKLDKIKEEQEIIAKSMEGKSEEEIRNIRFAKESLDAEDKLLNEHKLKSGSESKVVPQTENLGKHLLITGAGGLSASFRGMVNKSEKQEQKVSAYELIMQLQDDVNRGEISKGSNITDRIIEIFQQNEVDRGRSGIGQALLEKLEPLAERIGEVIANRELDPLVMVSLVGDGKVVNKRRFIKTEQLEELLDEKRKTLGSHEKTPLDEMLAEFQNPKFVMGAIVETLQTLKGRDRAVFATLFSDDVLLHAGVGKKEIPQLRKDGHDAMFEFVKTQTMELAKHSPEELKELGLTDKKIETIMSLNELLAEGKDKEKEVKAAIDGGGEAVGAVRDAELFKMQKVAEKGEKAPDYWAKLIKQKPKVVVAEKPKDVSMAEAVKANKEGGQGQALPGMV